MLETIISADLQAAVGLLNDGECVAIPTETVYGLAANALHEEAVLKIFEIKNRPHFDPLIVHTHSIYEIEKFVETIPDWAFKLMENFSPGPITYLLPKKNIVPDLVTSGLNTVAIRIPGHSLTLELLKRLQFPLAAPSANPFGYISPTKALHVKDQLDGKIKYILDGGDCKIGVESTIIGLENDLPTIFRLGGIVVEEIEKVIGKVQVRLESSSNPHSPGMLLSHYAPRKPLLFDNVEENLKLNSEKKIGIISFFKKYDAVENENQILLSQNKDLHEAAKNLFAAMRKLDAANVEMILAEKFPESGLGRAINDRLKRAAKK